MSRTAKLNTTEANSVLALKGKVPVDKLVKKLKVSRSTIYRICPSAPTMVSFPE